MNNNNKKIIKIRIDLEEGDSCFREFNFIKEKLGINANTEVLRYTIKKTFDMEKIEQGKKKY